MCSDTFYFLSFILLYLLSFCSVCSGDVKEVVAIQPPYIYCSICFNVMLTFSVLSDQERLLLLQHMVRLLEFLGRCEKYYKTLADLNFTNEIAKKRRDMTQRRKDVSRVSIIIVVKSHNQFCSNEMRLRELLSSVCTN